MLILVVVVAVAKGLGEAIERREDWLLFLEISVHGWLDPLFPGCGEAEDHGRRTQRKKTVTSW